MLGRLVPWLLLPYLASLVAYALVRLQVGESPEDGEAKLWGLSAWIALFIIGSVHFALMTRGTGELMSKEMLGSAFDSLADALVQGRSQIDPRSIRWEGFVVDGRTTMYFGPLPALLRIPLHWLMPSGFGEWSRTSCLLASMLALMAFATIALRALLGNPGLAGSLKRIVLIASLMGFGFGTPLCFLMYAGSIYHESIVWGLAGSVWGIALLLSILGSRQSFAMKLTFLAVVTGATLLARVTYGAPFYLILLLIAGDALRRAARDPDVQIAGEAAKLFACLTPAGVMLLIQLWYNFDRFGSIFTFVDYEHLAFMRNDAAAWTILQEAGTFNPKRMGPAFYNYFGVSRDFFSSSFPWFELARPEYPDWGLYPRLFKSYLVSLSLASSWIVLGAAVGSGYLFARTSSWIVRLCGIAFLLEIGLVSSYYIMELRYSIDFFPYLIFAYAFFLASMGARQPLRGRGQELASVLLFSVALSCIVTVSSTLSAIPVSGPATTRAYKEDWAERFRAIDRAVAGLRGGAATEATETR
jgi:hypothetical protein